MLRKYTTLTLTLLSLTTQTTYSMGRMGRFAKPAIIASTAVYSSYFIQPVQLEGKKPQIPVTPQVLPVALEPQKVQSIPTMQQKPQPSWIGKAKTAGTGWLQWAGILKKSKEQELEDSITAICNFLEKDRLSEALSEASKSYNNIELFEWLADHKGREINEEFLNNLLAASIIDGKTEIVDLLVKKGINQLNYDYEKSKSGVEKPIQLAAEKGRTEICKLLIAAGADVNPPLRPLDHPYSPSRFDGRKLPLYRAAINNHIETCKVLIATGADVNQALEAVVNEGYNYYSIHSDLYDTTCLVDACKVLIDLGADVNKITNPRLAFSTKIFKLFRHHGLDINNQDSAGKTMLHHQAREQYPSWGITCEELLSLGADVNAVDKNGETPLWEAIRSSCYGHEKDYEKICKLLLEHGADVNIANKKCSTVLHDANSSKICSLFLKYGANVNAVNIFGCTPLDYAVKANNPEKCRLLLEHGACISPITRKLVNQSKNPEIVEIFAPKIKEFGNKYFEQQEVLN